VFNEKQYDVGKDAVMIMNAAAKYVFYDLRGAHFSNIDIVFQLLNNILHSTKAKQAIELLQF
jgi:hypothetical protein